MSSNIGSTMHYSILHYSVWYIIFIPPTTICSFKTSLRNFIPTVYNFWVQKVITAQKSNLNFYVFRFFFSLQSVNFLMHRWNLSRVTIWHHGSPSLRTSGSFAWINGNLGWLKKLHNFICFLLISAHLSLSLLWFSG